MEKAIRPEHSYEHTVKHPKIAVDVLYMYKSTIEVTNEQWMGNNGDNGSNTAMRQYQQSHVCCQDMLARHTIVIVVLTRAIFDAENFSNIPPRVVHGERIWV